MKISLEQEIEIPSGITATMTKNSVTIKGKTELTRTINDPLVKIKVDSTKIMLTCEKGTKRQKRMMNSFAAHIRNMIEGVQRPYQYRMKICSGHFPMNVSTSGNQFIIKNFLGEKCPRTLTMKQGATVKIDGDQILIESPDKDLAGAMASDIELLTAKANKDLRVFQDGIYIIEKAGKKVSEQ